MWNIMKRGFGRAYNGQGGCQQTEYSDLIPRLWVILLVLACPFLVVCASFFEELERTGAKGAIIADTLLPGTIIGYIVLVFILRSRKI